MTEAEKWMLGGMIISTLLTLGGLIISIVAINKKQEVQISDQPISIKLQEQFAGKHEFQEHVQDNDRQRGMLHKRIDRVIADYNDKFQTLPNEIVALLKNTGAIK